MTTLVGWALIVTSWTWLSVWIGMGLGDAKARRDVELPAVTVPEPEVVSAPAGSLFEAVTPASPAYVLRLLATVSAEGSPPRQNWGQLSWSEGRDR